MEVEDCFFVLPNLVLPDLPNSKHYSHYEEYPSHHCTSNNNHQLCLAYFGTCYKKISVYFFTSSHHKSIQRFLKNLVVFDVPKLQFKGT